MIDRENTYRLRLKATVDGKTHFIRITIPATTMREISPLWTYDLGERREPMSDLELFGLLRAHASVAGRDTRWMRELIL